MNACVHSFEACIKKEITHFDRDAFVVLARVC